MIRSIESLLLDASNGEPVQEISEDIKIFLNDDIDQDRMKTQLLMLQDAITPTWVSQK